MGEGPAPSHVHGSPPALDCRPPLRARPRRRPRAAGARRGQRGGGPPCVRPPHGLLLASPTPGVHPGAWLLIIRYTSSWMQPDTSTSHHVRRDVSSRHLARRPPAPHRRSAHVSAPTPAPGSSPAVGQGRRAMQEHVAARSAHEHPYPDLPVRRGRRGGGRKRTRCFGRRRGMRTGMRTHTAHVLSAQRTQAM
ncbi:hypothetical protein B0H13DRAFT_2098179 [Mycena leptocephala]|nr:hypothetical protein B0H13DRAFT_2098179 [Mycena leptocephala]